jgi:protein ImuA
MIAFADAAAPARRFSAADPGTLLSLLPPAQCAPDSLADSPAALLAALPDSVWRASQMGASRGRATPSGHAALDRELPNGGWPASVLIELLLSQNGIGELRLLAPVLASLTQAGKSVILLAPPHLPFAPALAELGLDLQHVLLIQTDKPMDRIWAVEQTLKSASFGALLCWLPQARPDHLRRLQLAAAGGEGLCFVFRPAAMQRESSPAPLRIACRAGSDGGITVDIVKRRGPVFGKPILLPLPVPAVLQAPFARRAAPLPVFSTPNATANFPSNTVVTAVDHAVDRPVPAAIAARYDPAVAA